VPGHGAEAGLYSAEFQQRSSMRPRWSSRRTGLEILRPLPAGGADVGDAGPGIPSV